MTDKATPLPSTSDIAAAFYLFAELPDYADLRAPLLAVCEKRGVRGSILLAREGINGTIAGRAPDVRGVLDWLRSQRALAALTHKESPAPSRPFRRMKVRLKKEIVTMGVPSLEPARDAGQYVSPEDWNALIGQPDVVLIDARNEYEVSIGRFDGAIDPGTGSFSELPAWLDHCDVIGPDTRVAMYCTGGIRCEKSTAYLRKRGVRDVYHLQGGILAYLEKVSENDSRWRGECFVFDERVAVGHGLAPGSHTLCRACRRPLSPADRESPHYVEGVSCAACHEATDAQKKQRFAERQRQVTLAEERGEEHLAVRRPGG